MFKSRVIIACLMVAFSSVFPAYGMKRVSRMASFLRNYSTHKISYLNSMRQLRMDKLDAVQRLRAQKKAFTKLNYLIKGKTFYHGTDLALTTDKAFPDKEEIDHYQDQLDHEPIYFSATTNEDFCVRSSLSEEELKQQLNNLQKQMHGSRFGWCNMFQISRGLLTFNLAAHLLDFHEMFVNHPIVFLGTIATTSIYGLCNTVFGIKNGITRCLFLKSEAGKNLAQHLEDKKKHYEKEK
jgi:hypothetical protein